MNSEHSCTQETTKTENKDNLKDGGGRKIGYKCCQESTGIYKLGKNTDNGWDVVMMGLKKKREMVKN